MILHQKQRYKNPNKNAPLEESIFVFWYIYENKTYEDYLKIAITASAASAKGARAMKAK